MSEAYPLSWPAGWPRTESGQRSAGARFKTTFDRARKKMMHELRLLGATSVVVSSMLPVRGDGMPYASALRQRQPDPGVAVYFMLNGKPMVMARDAYDNMTANIASIAHAIAHMRGLERHGGATMMDKAFSGFVALDSKPHWKSVLTWGDHVPTTMQNATANYRQLAKAAASNEARLLELNLAIDQARRELGS